MITNVALIGYGDWAKILEKNLYLNPNYQIKKIYTSKTGNPKFTFNLNEIASDNEISAVVIATSPETHFGLTKFFLQNGKSVFCEKPLSYLVSELDELKEIVAGTSKKIFTNYTYMYSKDLTEKINIVKKVINTDIKVEMNFSQFGKFYKEDVYFTLTTHYLAILDELINLNDTTFLVNSTITNNGFVVSSDLDFYYNNYSGSIKSSIINPIKSRYIKFQYDNKLLEYQPLNINKSNSLYEKQNVFLALEHFHKILNFDLDDNFEKSYRIIKAINSFNI
jgi:predicted dehydrogenase